MPDELTPHVDALRRWIERQAKVPAPAPSMSSDERKQLQAVNKSIQQLTNLGVGIPDDLRHLKLRLLARDVGSAAESEMENRLAQLESLVKSLRDLTKEARALRNRLKGSGQIPATKKHYGVSLKTLLQGGHLSVDDKLELQIRKDGPVFDGKVQSDGSLSVKTDAGWSQFDSLSAAAVSIGERALNGWDHWSRVEPDDSRTPLSVIRAKYLNEGSDS